MAEVLMLKAVESWRFAIYTNVLTVSYIKISAGRSFILQGIYFSIAD